MSMFKNFTVIATLVCLFLLSGCGGGGGSADPAVSPPASDPAVSPPASDPPVSPPSPPVSPPSPPVSPVYAWTWVSGSNLIDQTGAYGTKGVAASTNMPGARRWAVSWIDAGGNIWLFGGRGYDSAGNGGPLNDLWKFDGTNWTWVSGSNVAYQAGTYGTKGTAASGNVPGAREAAVSWKDVGGNFWLFGGQGYDSAGNGGLLNDLWKFDGTNWTWVSGSNLSDLGQAGTYGTKGVAASGNMPGARRWAVSWIDAGGNFWLFGGQGNDSAGNWGHLNDLWKFDGTNWTWVSGSNVAYQAGTYGTKGTAASGNVPGARDFAVSWTDAGGNFWLFGGNGLDSAGNWDDLNDLWKFDGTNWTWVSGSNVANQTGTYGTKGTAASGNVPGAREAAVSWIDAGGNFWLFGGQGYDSAGNQDNLNDLWKFDGTNWTWVSGSNLIDQTGTYGTKGTAASGNVPGAREAAVSWIDAGGNFWLFGGQGYDSAGNQDNLNDLWRYGD